MYRNTAIFDIIMLNKMKEEIFPQILQQNSYAGKKKILSGKIY